MIVKIKLITILNVVSENPKNLNVTSLQLIVFSCSCFNNFFFRNILDAFLSPQTDDSLKNLLQFQNDKMKL